MSAKRELNSIHFLGALVLAGIAGGVAGSWSVCGIVFMALVLTGYYTGDIRR